MKGSLSGRPRSLQDEHRTTTRNRILRALIGLLAEEHPSSISMPAVAERAGVSIATLYRYFPTKEALLDGAAVYSGDLVRQDVGTRTVDLEDVETYLSSTWPAVAEIWPLVEAQHFSPAGRDIRRRRAKSRRREVVEQVRKRGIDPGSDAGTRLVELVMALISSSTLMELHDREELPVETAAAFVSWAIETLIAASTKEDGS